MASRPFLPENIDRCRGKLAVKTANTIRRCCQLIHHRASRQKFQCIVASCGFNKVDAEPLYGKEGKQHRLPLCWCVCEKMSMQGAQDRLRRGAFRPDEEGQSEIPSKVPTRQFFETVIG